MTRFTALRRTVRLSDVMDEFWPLIGYVQIGQSAGRHEPGKRELDCSGLCGRAMEKGYQGAIGMELDPSMGTSWTSLASG